MITATLDRVLLSFPSLISLAAKARQDDAPRSWSQFARTGSFVSNRYGKLRALYTAIARPGATTKPEDLRPQPLSSQSDQHRQAPTSIDGVRRGLTNGAHNRSERGAV